MESKYSEKLDGNLFQIKDHQYLDWFMRSKIEEINLINNRKSFNENELESYEVKIIDSIFRGCQFLNDNKSNLNNLESNFQNKQIDRESVQEQLKSIISQLYQSQETYINLSVSQFCISHLVFLLCIQKNYVQFYYRTTLYGKYLSNKQQQISLTLLNEFQVQTDLQNSKKKDNINQNAIQDIVNYDDQISQLETQIEEAIEFKLNILFMMKQKYLDLFQLQILLNQLLIKRRTIITQIQQIFQINFLNVKLQNMHQIYQQTLAFTDEDIQFSQKTNLNNNKILAKYSSNENACVIISELNNQSDQIIKKLSDNFKKVFHCDQNELINQSINKLMPQPYALVHQNYVKNYINNNSQKNMKSFSAFALIKNKYIQPILIELNLNMSLSYNLSNKLGFSIYVQKFNNQNQYILFNSSTFETISMSQKIHQDVFQTYQDFIQINLLQFFPIIHSSVALTLTQEVQSNKLNNKDRTLSNSKSFKIIKEIQKQEDNYFPSTNEFGRENLNQLQSNQKKCTETLGIKYLLILSDEKQISFKLKSLNPHSVSLKKQNSVNQFRFFIFYFDIKQVQSEYLTHLQYLEISQYEELNPVLDIPLILNFYKNQQMRRMYSNIDHVLNIQLEDLFKQFESSEQILTNNKDQEITKSSNDGSKFELNQSKNKKNSQRDQIMKNYNEILEDNNSEQNNNYQSFNFKENILYIEQPFTKDVNDFSNQQLESLIKQNSYQISLSKNQVITQQLKEKNLDFTIENLSQTQRYNLDSQDYISQQISERILKSHKNLSLLKQEFNNSQFKEISQNNFQNYEVGLDSNYQLNQLKTNINLNLQTQNQTQAQTSLSFIKNFNQQTLNNLINQNENKFPSQNDYTQQIQKYESQINVSQNLQKLNKIKNQESASNSTKSSSLLSTVKAIKDKILYHQRQFTIKFVTWFGILSLITISTLIIQQYFSISSLFTNFQADMNVVGWPTDYINTLSLIVKNFNLQKLIQRGYIYIEQDSVKQIMRNQSQQEIVFAISQIKNLTSFMEKNTDSRPLFQTILETPNKFRFGSNFNTKIPLNQQPADTYYQLVDFEMGLFYSIELIIIYLFRFAYGLGLGSGQFITLSNKEPISKQLSIISQKNISEMLDQIFSIQENILNVLIILIVVVFCCIFLILPLYSIIQAKKQKLLQLFGTFHPDIISKEIQDICDIIQEQNKSFKNVKNIISNLKIQQKNLKQQKKQSISTTSQLPKTNMKIILLTTLLFSLTIPYPVITQQICKDYINEAKVILEVIKQLYEVEQLVIENTSLHYLCIYLRINPVTTPYSYAQNREKVYQNIQNAQDLKSNLQTKLENLKAAKLHNRNLFDQFFFQIFESDICELMQKNGNLFVTGFEFSYEECYTIYNKKFSQGLTIALQQYFQYFPDLYEIYEISDQKKFLESFDKFQRNLDFEQFYKFEKYLVVILKTLSKFILTQTQEYEEFLINTLTYLLIYEFFILAILFYFEHIKFLKAMERELNKTKQNLSLLNVSFLLQNSYIQNFLQNNI